MVASEIRQLDGRHRAISLSFTGSSAPADPLPGRHAPKQNPLSPFFGSTARGLSHPPACWPAGWCGLELRGLGTRPHEQKQRQQLNLNQIISFDFVIQ